MRKLFPLLALLFISLAAAQDALPTLDPSKLGSDLFSLMAVVVFAVAFIKRRFVPAPLPPNPDGSLPPVAGRNIPGWAWWVLSIALAEAGAAALFYAKFGATVGDLPSPWGWLAYGLLAGIAASGAVDFAKGLLAALLRTRPAPVVIVTPSEGGLENIK